MLQFDYDRCHGDGINNERHRANELTKFAIFQKRNLRLTKFESETCST